MKNRSLLLIAGAWLLTLFFTGCKGHDTVDLKLNLQPGNKYLTTIETKTTMDQGGIGTTKNDMTMETLYEVAAGEGGDQKITVSYDRIAMAMTSFMGNMQYDSGDPSKQDSSLSSIANMLHKPFTMTVTDKGVIKKVDGLDGILNNFGDPTTAEGANMRKQMSGMFNDTVIRSMMQQSLNIFPDQKVQTGASWKKSYSSNMGPISMKVDNTYKLVSVNKGTAHIDVNSKISSTGAGAEDMQQVKFEMNGEQKGKMEVDVATGLVTNSLLKQTIKGSVNAMGSVIPMTIQSDIHITGKKL